MNRTFKVTLHVNSSTLSLKSTSYVVCQLIFPTISSLFGDIFGSTPSSRRDCVGNKKWTSNSVIYIMLMRSRLDYSSCVSHVCKCTAENRYFSYIWTQTEINTTVSNNVHISDNKLVLHFSYLKNRIKDVSSSVILEHSKWISHFCVRGDENKIDPPMK